MWWGWLQWGKKSSAGSRKSVGDGDMTGDWRACRMWTTKADRRAVTRRGSQWRRGKGRRRRAPVVVRGLHCREDRRSIDDTFLCSNWRRRLQSLPLWRIRAERPDVSLRWAAAAAAAWRSVHGCRWVTASRGIHAAVSTPDTVRGLRRRRRGGYRGRPFAGPFLARPLRRTIQKEHGSSLASPPSGNPSVHSIRARGSFGERRDMGVRSAPGRALAGLSVIVLLCLAFGGIDARFVKDAGHGVYSSRRSTLENGLGRAPQMG